MTNVQHAKVLCAYLNRLTVSDLEAILEAQRATWHAAMNLGISSQVQAREDATLTVMSAVCRMSEHDKKLIQNTIAATR